MINNHLCLWAGSFLYHRTQRLLNTILAPAQRPREPLKVRFMPIFEEELSCGDVSYLFQHHMVQRVPELGFLPPSQRRHFLDLSTPSHDSSDTMSLAKHPKNSTAQHGFGFKFKLAKNWRHEIETCRKGQENKQSRRECGSGQCPLLEGSRQTLDTSAVLMHGPLKHQTGVICPPVLRLPSEMLHNPTGK